MAHLHEEIAILLESTIIASYPASCVLPYNSLELGRKQPAGPKLDQKTWRDVQAELSPRIEAF
jgi:hypothetical protein